MTANKEKFLALVKETDTSFIKELDYRLKNADWLSESYGIAIKILIRLDELGWTQKDLAVKMGVKPQQINRVLRGKQNLTIETLIKLQQILSIPLLATYYEKQSDNTGKIALYGNEVEIYVHEKRSMSDLEYNTTPGKSYIIEMVYNNETEKYTYKKAS